MEKKRPYQEFAEALVASWPKRPLTPEQQRALENLKAALNPRPLPMRAGRGDHECGREDPHDQK